MFAFILGMSNHARSDIRTFASGIRIHPDIRIVYVRPFSHRVCHRAYCSFFVKIVLIMKDDGFSDENAGWTRIITKTVFRVSDQIRTNMAVHCTLYSGHEKG